MLEVEKIRQALEATSSNWKKHAEVLRQENQDALREACENQQLLDFFMEFSFDEAVEIGEFTLRQANCLKKDLTWDEDFKRGLSYNFLILGSGINGDMVVLDLLDYQAGILFHDYFWEKPAEDPRKYVIKMDCSLGQFYWNSAFVEGYPIDAYEAAAYMGAAFTGYAKEE